MPLWFWDNETKKEFKEKERITVPRKTVSEDMAEEINRALLNLKIGDIATVVYYMEENQQLLHSFLSEPQPTGEEDSTTSN